MLLRRHSRSGFMAGAYVFPGGKVDPADRDAVTPAILEQSKVLAETPGRPLEHRSRGAIVCAAIRETQEEASISLAAPDLVYWAH